MTKGTINKIGRIDQVVRDYFAQHPQENGIRAKDLMPLFIEKAVFAKDYKAGLPIRNLLRQLDGEGKLGLLKHVRVVRHAKNRSWYFERG